MRKYSIHFFRPMLTIFIIFFILFLSEKVKSSINRPPIFISKQDGAINFDPRIVDFFSMGYKRFITSIVWVSTILESDQEHYKAKDNNSWMFLRFNLISTLDEKFFENYAFGGPYLSIIKDDDLGARLIYDKGLKQFPNNYDLLLNAAFHYYFELSDLENAKKLYSQLIKFPNTPNYIISFYAKLMSKSGHLESSFQLIKNLYEKYQHIPAFEKRYRENLYSIKAEIDLECLNQGKKDCAFNDYYGYPYIYINGLYKAKIPWVQFKTKK